MILDVLIHGKNIIEKAIFENSYSYLIIADNSYLKSLFSLGIEVIVLPVGSGKKIIDVKAEPVETEDE